MSRISCVLFDLDGVLVDATEWHYEALNLALSPFGLENDNEVFYAADRPFGLIEGTVTRDETIPADHAW